MDAPIHVVSATTDQGMAQLREYVTLGKTIALLGSSGVGKSTMTNYLLGQDYFDTGAVRSSDSRGRHTTTYRELCLLETGGMLIDTPGMREIQIWADQDSLAASFADITSLAAICRFNDCQHHTEPRCAVQAAIKDGTLPSSRLATFEKFTEELAVLTARNSTQGRPEKAKAGKPKAEKRSSKKKS
jgi:ribosome biogenesis GTPase